MRRQFFYLLECVSSLTFLTESGQLALTEKSLQNYNAHYRPQIDRQLQVFNNFYIQLVSDINEQSMDYELTVFFRYGARYIF